MKYLVRVQLNINLEITQKWYVIGQLITQLQLYR